ncbi:MAG TPA: patatin-like phospholipase family protein [Nitrososphaeraceae archaeon]|nr:patatin-like phospholipase family protein [Nitrososphaeraceae archaeon]
MKRDSGVTGMSSSRSTIKNVENIFIMLGGGSLGAFGCGVFKGFMKRNFRIDVAAGTSIGAVNAAIIVGSKSGHPEIDLEEFWLEIAESTPSIIPDIFPLDYDKDARTYVPTTTSSAAANAALFGVPKMFVPRWLMWNCTPELKDKENLFDPVSWTYMYDHSPLAKTLDKYIDYKKLNLAATPKEEEKPEVLRLIMTAVNVMTAKPLIFDNTKKEIKAKHILASAGYPLYGFHWVEVQDGVYAWDGGLLSNTPIREVIYSSPRNDKNIIIVENYPQRIERLPSNLMEVQSRARDILFCDKDMDDIKMSKFITRQIQLIQRLYDVFERFEQDSGFQPSEIARIKSEYNTLIQKYGARILSVTRIIRSEIEPPTVLKNANFSPHAVKELIAQGEAKAIEKIDKLSKDNPATRTVI